jgi:hypothetical protein
MTGMEVALFMIERAFSFNQGLTINLTLPIWILLAVLFLVDLFQERKEDFFENFHTNRFYSWLLIGFVLGICFLIYSVSISQPFVYFQF